MSLFRLGQLPQSPFGSGGLVFCVSRGSAVQQSLLVKPQRVQADEPIPLDPRRPFLVVDMPPLPVAVADRTSVSGAEQALRSLDDRVVLGTSERAERAVAGGVAHGVVRRVGTRTAVDQVVAAIVLDHPGAFGDVAGASFPV